MRRYDIVSRILLILFITDFALAAPVLVQEKRQACVDVAHISRDVITVLGKRFDEELQEFEKQVNDYFKVSKKLVESSGAHASSSSAPPRPNPWLTSLVHWQAPVLNPASSDAHASSSSAPLRPDHGSTKVVQVPAPDPASSTANPHPLMKPSSPSSTAPAATSDSEEYEWLYELEGDDELHGPLYIPTSSGHGLGHELSSAPPGPVHESTNVVQAPAPDPASSTSNPNPLMKPPSPSSTASMAPSDSEEYEWLYELEGDDELHGPLYTPTSPGHGLDHEFSSESPGPDHGSTNVVQTPAPDPASSTANPNPLTEPPKKGRGLTRTSTRTIG